MKAEQFRGMLKGKQFHPFAIHTASGETYEVKHPETVWQSPEGGTVLVSLGGEAVVLIDTDQITECVRHVPKKRTRSE